MGPASNCWGSAARITGTQIGRRRPSLLGFRRLARYTVRRRHIARLTEARERVAATGILPSTMDEIQAEIGADRVERSGRNDG